LSKDDKLLNEIGITLPSKLPTELVITISKIKHEKTGWSKPTPSILIKLKTDEAINEFDQDTQYKDFLCKVLPGEVEIELQKCFRSIKCQYSSTDERLKSNGIIQLIPDTLQLPKDLVIVYKKEQDNSGKWKKPKALIIKPDPKEFLANIRKEMNCELNMSGAEVIIGIFEKNLSIEGDLCIKGIEIPVRLLIAKNEVKVASKENGLDFWLNGLNMKDFNINGTIIRNKGAEFNAEMAIDVGEVHKEFNPNPLRGKACLVVSKSNPTPKVKVKFAKGAFSIEKILLAI